MSNPMAAVPTWVRVAMAHAVLQRTADVAGVDLLHIKGPAVDPSLGRPHIGGTDADVLVRPGDVERFIDSLRRAGWQQLSTFRSDSDFESAVTLTHPEWQYADVHRFFPGIGAPSDAAFERLWRDHTRVRIAGVACGVPDRVGQSLILLLNAARSESGPRPAEVDALWHSEPPDRRTMIVRLADELQAEVALAAATGELERYRDRRDYELWRIESRGGTRAEKWLARIRAAPTRRDAVRIALRAPRVNVEHLSVVLGRPPSRREVLREFLARPARGLAEEVRVRRRRRRRRA